MPKNTLFWICMSFNMMVLILFSLFKEDLHHLPHAALTLAIKLQMLLQIGVGIYALWESIDRKLFFFFLKVYGLLFFGYILIKIPALNFLESYYVVVPAMFTPFPFVITWILDQAFNQFNQLNPKNEQ